MTTGMYSLRWEKNNFNYGSVGSHSKGKEDHLDVITQVLKYLDNADPIILQALESDAISKNSVRKDAHRDGKGTLAHALKAKKTYAKTDSKLLQFEEDMVLMVAKDHLKLSEDESEFAIVQEQANTLDEVEEGVKLVHINVNSPDDPMTDLQKTEERMASINAVQLEGSGVDDVGEQDEELLLEHELIGADALEEFEE
ncbi:hypothetical protein CYMTET_45062 [Cymbomonas tetramitiformis]|uniref:Uncharacterized protein n=1 Tax=Cymbomonas tetramitiformis TaxID=36881 RepID=A0AAE0C122_9CHLO|nr:hypothetical protein CYMTET_45062 [Cymbomonas tetramitiformis]